MVNVEGIKTARKHVSSWHNIKVRHQFNHPLMQECFESNLDVMELAVNQLNDDVVMTLILKQEEMWKKDKSYIIE